jgi:hypothetical protein
MKRFTETMNDEEKRCPGRPGALCQDDEGRVPASLQAYDSAPPLEATDQALRRAIQEPGGASIINVFGPARVGKSTMKNHVIRTIILEMLPLLQQDRERVPLLSLMPRPPLSGYFSWKVFFQGALMAFDEPMIDHKIAHGPEDDEDPTGLIRRDESRIKHKPPEGTKDALRQSFETNVKRRRPVAIFIDEAQHLDNVSSDRQRQNQVDCIKSLADDTGTIFVMYNQKSSPFDPFLRRCLRAAPQA